MDANTELALLSILVIAANHGWAMVWQRLPDRLAGKNKAPSLWLGAPHEVNIDMGHVIPYAAKLRITSPPTRPHGRLLHNRRRDTPQEVMLRRTTPTRPTGPANLNSRLSAV